MSLRIASRRITPRLYATRALSMSSFPRSTLSRCNSSLLRPMTHSFRYISTEQRQVLQKAITESPVVLFMKGTPEQPQCGFSRATVQILDLQQVPREKLKTYNVLESDELRENIKEFSDWPTVPQLYVNGEFVGGCDIVLGMHQSGELETMLEKQGIIPNVEPAAAAAAAATEAPAST